MSRPNGGSPTIWVVCGSILLLWGILTAFAYQRQEGTIKALEAKIEAYENQLSDQIRKTDLLMVYIDLLDRMLRENGWTTVPPLPVGNMEEQENGRSGN